MLDLEDIRAFVEVAESGGFGRASVRLKMSKSIVSRRVARLETELRAKLLSRTTRGIVVTEAGVSFKEHADRVIAELTAAREAVDQDGDDLSGELRIAAPLSFGTAHIAPLIAELASRHPKLRLQTAYSDRRVDLIADHFDVAIRLGVLPDSSLIARRVAPLHAVVIASPDYLKRHGTPRELADLRRHETLTRSERSWQFVDGKRTVSIAVTGRFESDSGEALVAAALAGLGIALLPTFLVGTHISTGALVPILREFSVPEAGIYIVRPPPAGHMPRKVRVLSELLIERFGGEPYWDACAMNSKAADNKKFASIKSTPPATIRGKARKA